MYFHTFNHFYFQYLIGSLVQGILSFGDLHWGSAIFVNPHMLLMMWRQGGSVMTVMAMTLEMQIRKTFPLLMMMMMMMMITVALTMIVVMMA